MERLNYIPRDGYTEDAYIAAIPGLIDKPLRFKYRPALVEERAEYFDAADKLTTASKRQLAANAFVAKRLVSWDHADTHGDVIPIDAVSVGRLKFALHDRLYGIVVGFIPTDLDPEWSDEKSQNAADEEYQSARFNAPIGDVKQAETEKN